MKFWKFTLMGALLILSTSANAALVSRLGGLAYYDTDANLTWLADANYAMTSGYDSDGRMNWNEANSWATGLNIADVTGWRLPDAIHSDITCESKTGTLYYGYNCTMSEMGNMFYNVLGGSLGKYLPTDNANYGLFENIQNYQYWTTMEFPYNSLYAVDFAMIGGHQYRTSKISRLSAWAVHTGDVSAVPVPAAVWLFGSGLIGLIGFARR